MKAQFYFRGTGKFFLSWKKRSRPETAWPRGRAANPDAERAPTVMCVSRSPLERIGRIHTHTRPADNAYCKHGRLTLRRWTTTAWYGHNFFFPLLLLYIFFFRVRNYCIHTDVNARVRRLVRQLTPFSSRRP